MLQIFISKESIQKAGKIDKNLFQNLILFSKIMRNYKTIILKKIIMNLKKKLSLIENT